MGVRPLPSRTLRVQIGEDCLDRRSWVGRLPVTAGPYDGIHSFPHKANSCDPCPQKTSHLATSTRQLKEIWHLLHSLLVQEGDLIISVLRSQGYPGAAGIIQVGNTALANLSHYGSMLRPVIRVYRVCHSRSTFFKLLPVPVSMTFRA